jgi:hypothetical protein
MDMTRDEMIAIINRGESVMVGDGMHRRIVSRIEDLPSEVDAAKGDKEKLLAAREGLVARRASLDAEIAATQASTGQGVQTGTEQPAAGPAESGSGGRSQITAAVGTANSDAESDAQTAPPDGGPATGANTPPADDSGSGAVQKSSKK